MGADVEPVLVGALVGWMSVVGNGGLESDMNRFAAEDVAENLLSYLYG